MQTTAKRPPKELGILHGPHRLYLTGVDLQPVSQFTEVFRAVPTGEILTTIAPTVDIEVEVIAVEAPEVGGFRVTIDIRATASKPTFEFTP
ncbi:MAG: hypothetical protein IPM02_08095 [Betaproteobacteria bacterium]|nr:hypothetical protein [Betaproteobacteria bacterium]